MLLWPAAAQADQSDLAAYMRARVADADGRVGTAVTGYAQALAAAPGDLDIALRAYREALAAGDIALAQRAATTLRGSAVAAADLPLLALGLAAHDGDAKGANAAIVDLDKGLLRVLGPALRGWTAYAANADPLPQLAQASSAKDPIATRFAVEQRGLLQIARGNTADGLATVRAAMAAGAPIDLRLSAAALLFREKHDDDARALLTGNDSVLAALRKNANGAKPTLGFGVSRLLARVAGDLAGQGPSDLGIALTRAALIADPDNDRARLLLAEALARGGATNRALAVLGGVKASSPFADSAASARVTVLANADRDAEALAAAQGQAQAKDADIGDFQVYADRLVAANRYADAAPWYGRVVALDGGQWTAWLQYGGALDQAGDWAAAKPALEKSVALAPAEPLALNYLGYAKAGRGEDMAGATKLLERASALKPDDLSITDSLGWVYYLDGKPGRALPLIERASKGEPANAEIGEHLGDVYWTLGRRYEARYAWRAAALTAEAKDAPRLADKIAHGLPARK